MEDGRLRDDLTHVSPCDHQPAIGSGSGGLVLLTTEMSRSDGNSHGITLLLQRRSELVMVTYVVHKIFTNQASDLQLKP